MRRASLESAAAHTRAKQDVGWIRAISDYHVRHPTSYPPPTNVKPRNFRLLHPTTPFARGRPAATEHLPTIKKRDLIYKLLL